MPEELAETNNTETESEMKKRYTVFILDLQRELHSDESYSVLGSAWGSYETKKEAKDIAKYLLERDIGRYGLTILEIFSK